MGRVLEFLIVSVLARVFPGRYRLIPRMPDGAPLLRQFRLCSFGKEEPRGVPPKWHFSIYLQSFVNPEVFDDFHIHRWGRMISFVLSGWFLEERREEFWGILRTFRTWHVPHTAPSFYTMRSDVIHRFHDVGPRTWTLFVMMGRNKLNPPGGWGYYDRYKGSYRPWDAAIPAEKRIAAL